MCGLALLAARVAEATGRLESGVSGRLLARFDVAATVIVVVAIAAAARPFVAAYLDRRNRPSYAAHVRAWLVPMYALWIPIVVVNEAMVAPATGPRKLLLTTVLFRDPRSSPPIPGLGIGAGVVRRRHRGARRCPRSAGSPACCSSGRGGRTALLRLSGVLVVTGIAVRAMLVAAGSTEPFGALSWLPAHLDSFGAAIAIVTLHESGWFAARRHTARVAALLAVTTFAVAALVAGLPRALLVTDGRDIQVRAVLYVVIAAAVTVVARHRPRRPSARDDRARVRGARARAGPRDVVHRPRPPVPRADRRGRARRAPSRRDRRCRSGCGRRVSPPASASRSRRACSCRCDACATGRWPPNPYPIALAAVVAGGFLVRVATWLTIAPQKTDGGDPLFYHVTANTIARGRGFPEPLNWLDSATHIPSALHGPLYPVVLSISSRLGGTTYVDHKFVSILIGSATVLVTALVAERLGGKRAAIAAGALAAVYPNLWLIDSLLFPEGLFALLTTACVLVAYRWRDRPTLARAALIGGLIGLSALTRGEGLLLGVVLAMPWMLRHRQLPLARAMAPSRRRRRDVRARAGAVDDPQPAHVRGVRAAVDQRQRAHRVRQLRQVYNGRLIGFWSFDCQEQLPDRVRRSAGRRVAEGGVLARAWASTTPATTSSEVPKVVAIRVLRQWELFRPWQTVEFSTIENRDKDSAALGLGMYYVLAAGAIAGAVMLRRRGVPLLPLGAQVLSVTLTAAYAYGTVRFRAPVEPVLCILAGVAAVPLLTRAWRWAMPPDLPVDQIPVDDPTAFVLGGSGGLRRRAQGARGNWLGIGIVGLAVAIPLRGLYVTTGGTMEEGFMLYFPERMWEGDVPNVDFLHLYGPGALHVLMGWYKVFGFTLGAERTFGLLQHLGIIFGLYALARAWGRAAATAVATLSTLLILTPIGLTAMAWNGGLALTLWSAVFGVRAVHLQRARRRAATRGSSPACWPGWR